ncbi:hypothetical protein K438DRAFT_1849862 [Mycena galopus ATCC 62051]|nr:hypothetical protein K438DRAFT_1849862 [Mycena galopus ATCC 62051]
MGIFIVAKTLLLCGGFKYSYRRGLDNILALLVGGILIAMTLSHTLGRRAAAHEARDHRNAYHRHRGAHGCPDSVLGQDNTHTPNKLTMDKRTI